MGNIYLSVEDSVGKIIINNPDKMNCLDMSMLHDLDKLLLQISSNKNIGAIWITGAGEKAFSSGANLTEFTSLDEAGTEEWIKYGNNLFNKLESLPIPTIAAINGYAFGGGLELALACDIRIATETSIFAFPELKHGWIPGWGGLSRLRRLIGEAKAKYIIMLGEKINAQYALDIGIISRICPTKQLDKTVTSMLNHLIGLDPFVFEIAKNALMDVNRGTSSNDVLFEVLATQHSKKKN